MQKGINFHIHHFVFDLFNLIRFLYHTQLIVYYYIPIRIVTNAQCKYLLIFVLFSLLFFNKL